MLVEIGHVEALFRYPVKSMAGERLEAVEMGLHGLEGDRRFALRKIDDRGGFPWLTATKVPELLRYTPMRGKDEALPTHVRTPDGDEFPIFSEELAADVVRRHGAPLQMTYLRNGIFDDASISVIASDTVHELTRLGGVSADVRRFRPNVLVRLFETGPFREDAWVGGALRFGDASDAPTIAVTTRDVRCAMVNFDPDTVHSTPDILKAVVRENENNAGIYGTVVRTGRVAVGQAVFLRNNGIPF